MKPQLGLKADKMLTPSPNEGCNLSSDCHDKLKLDNSISDAGVFSVHVAVVMLQSVIVANNQGGQLGGLKIFHHNNLAKHKSKRLGVICLEGIKRPLEEHNPVESSNCSERAQSD